MKSLTSLRFYALTKLADCIDLNLSSKWEEFIDDWKRKRNETLTKGEESV
jgi:hypothetical protein